MEILNFEVKDGYKVQFTASVPKEEWSVLLIKRSLDMQRKKPVKGFRVGNAPLAMAEKEYGDVLYKQTARETADKSIEKACLDYQVIPVSVPRVDIFQADAKGFVCGVTFEKYPEVTHMTYKGIRAEKPVSKCTEAQIDEEIDRFLRQHLDVHRVDREARMGDIAQVSFTGTHNGGSFPYDRSNGSRFVLGSGQLFAGLDEALCGHVAGEHLHLTLTMPQNFHRADVAGLTLDLEVDLEGVWARDMRELDDAFVKEFVPGAETVEQYRDKLRQSIQKRLDDQSERLFYANVNKELARAVPVEIPRSMVETTAKRYMETLASFARGQGMTMEQYLAREGKTEEDYKKMVEPAAWEQTAVSVAVDYVISAEGLQVSQERLQRYYQRYAAANKMTLEEARRYIDEPALIDEYLHKDAMKLIRAAAEAVVVEVESLPNVI